MGLKTGSRILKDQTRECNQTGEQHDLLDQRFCLKHTSQRHVRGESGEGRYDHVFIALAQRQHSKNSSGSCLNLAFFVHTSAVSLCDNNLFVSTLCVHPTHAVSTLFVSTLFVMIISLCSIHPHSLCVNTALFINLTRLVITRPHIVDISVVLNAQPV